MATNVITPIIDLTPSAEGSQLPDYLQKALTFGDITAFNVGGVSTTTLMNSPGFWLIEFNAQNLRDENCYIDITDGLSSKRIWKMGSGPSVTASSDGKNIFYRNVWLLSAGDSVSATTSTLSRICGNYRQIADISGNLVNPDGYTP